MGAANQQRPIDQAFDRYRNASLEVEGQRKAEICERLKSFKIECGKTSEWFGEKHAADRDMTGAYRILKNRDHRTNIPSVYTIQVGVTSREGGFSDRDNDPLLEEQPWVSISFGPKPSQMDIIDHHATDPCYLHVRFDTILWNEVEEVLGIPNSPV